MKTSIIILVEIDFRHELVVIKGSKSTYTYYSNLTLAVNALETILSLQGWDQSQFNYTAVYRALRAKRNYVKNFKTNSTAFFRIKISKVQLNPKLDSLGISQNPDLK